MNASSLDDSRFVSRATVNSSVRRKKTNEKGPGNERRSIMIIQRYR
jgi:hypothetical protein